MKVKIAVDRGGQQLKVQADFPKQDWQLLLNYSECVHDLRRTRAFQKPLHVRMNFKLMFGEGLSVKIELPDWDDVIVLLHRLRPLILLNEPTFFGRIRNLLYQHIDNPGIREMLAYDNRLFTGDISLSQMRISLYGGDIRQELTINSDNFFHTWLNAYEYHRDDEKRQFVERINKVFPEDASKAFLVSLVIDKVKAVNNLCGLIDVLSGELKEYIYTP